MQKVTSNAPADLVTHYPEAIDDLIKEGKVVGRRVDFARAGVGVAVKAGAPKPDISTPEAFKHAMLVAKSIAYSRTGASGIIAAKLMERLGLSEQLKDKTKLVDGVPVAEIVARGEAEIGIRQINVILPVAGADYVGPLPAELQGYVDFAVGVKGAPGTFRAGHYAERGGRCTILGAHRYGEHADPDECWLKRYRPQVGTVNPQQRDIGRGIASDELCRHRVAAGKCDGEFAVLGQSFIGSNDEPWAPDEAARTRAVRLDSGDAGRCACD